MKADELWGRYVKYLGARYGVNEEDFGKALHEYGEAVRAEAKKVCLEVNTDRMPASTEGFTVSNTGLGCAAAIEKMKLP